MGVAAFGILAVMIAGGGDDRPPPPDGVRTFDGLATTHVDGPVEYPQTPPVGGPHAPPPRWQNCGFYSEPVPDEQAVHSLEHGAVWITHDPGLPVAQVDALRELANDESYVLVSPYADLPAPVVASAWGRQLALESATDERLGQFIDAFVGGEQAPEPGAPCREGAGEPQNS